MSQLGFFDIANCYVGLDAKNDPLLKIDSVVPWEDFRPHLEAVWRKPSNTRKSSAGRKPWDAVLMFKAIVLCALYNLSDDQVEYQIRDRLSFVRFLGLGLEDRVPDAKTMWLYRAQLAQAGMIATVFGYKPHISIDRRFGFIRGQSVTSAPSPDGRQLKHVVSTANTSAEVWADSAYRSQSNEKWLAGKTLVSRIHRKKPKGKPMPQATARANAKKSSVRARVEHVFAHQKTASACSSVPSASSAPRPN